MASTESMQQTKSNKQQHRKYCENTLNNTGAALSFMPLYGSARQADCMDPCANREGSLVLALRHRVGYVWVAFRWSSSSGPSSQRSWSSRNSSSHSSARRSPPSARCSAAASRSSTRAPRPWRRPRQRGEQGELSCLGTGALWISPGGWRQQASRVCRVGVEAPEEG